MSKTITKKIDPSEDPEITAISALYTALKHLDSEAQKRVLDYVAAKLKIERSNDEAAAEAAAERTETRFARDETTDVADADIEQDGINSVAKRWMARNGLDGRQLGKIFSIGGDEIDLVAKAVPGSNKKERMRSVFLLKGVAAYLGTGAARFTHEKMKEACLHYDAFDAANFAKYFQGIVSEVSGTKEAGYTLTARGLASATEMVKELVKG